MDHNQTHSLWLSPFGEPKFLVQDRIKKLSDRYSSPLFEPHVTLLGGLHTGVTELVQLTDTLAGSLRPFDIVLTDAGYTDTFFQSLFIHVAKSEELLNARKIAEKLFEIKPEESFNPHLSLLYGDLDRKEKERILNVMGRQFHIRFTVHNVLLVNTTGMPENWEEVHSSEFGR